MPRVSKRSWGGSPQAGLIGFAVRALPWMVLVAGLARIALALGFSRSPTGIRFGNEFVDLGVYRMGGAAILDGLPVYEVLYPPYDLPFTYPPFAAVIFVPLAVLPAGAAQVLMVLASLACLLVCARVIAIRLPDVLGGPLPWSLRLTTLGLFGLGGMLEPTTTTLDLGQVNLLLMAAVLIDSLVIWRFAGALVGLAASVKIVPGIFALAMLPTRRWREFRNACLAFLATVLVGALVHAQDSWLFWTELFYDDGRQASVVTALNQSLYADAIRLAGKPAGVYLWAVVAVGVLVLGLTTATRYWANDRLTSTVTVAVTGLLISPVSWNHHWVWLMPALACAAALSVRVWRSGRTWLGLAIGAYAGFFLITTAIGPIKLANVSQGFGATASEWMIGNSLVAAGVGFLVVAVVALPVRRTTPQGETTPVAQVSP